MKKILCLAITLLLSIVLGLKDGHAFSIQWVPESDDTLTTVGGYDILEYQDAGPGGLDWTISGGGSHTGTWGPPSMIWLIDTPNTASATFGMESTAISFMMHGNGNDGYAQFLVDGVDVGTYDMYMLGFQSLIVTGLSYGFHTIDVVQTGNKNPLSFGNHVHILGGAALDAPVPEPATILLLGFGLIGLAVNKKRKRS